MKVRALLTTALVSMSFFWAAAPASAAVYDISVTAVSYTHLDVYKRQACD